MQMITRAEYLTLLTNAVERNVITVDEASALLARFDRGDFAEDSLPLPITEIKRVERDNKDLLLLFAFLATKGDTRRSKKLFRERTRKKQVSEVSQFMLESAQQDTAQFQRGFSDIVQRSILTQWIGGARQQDWTQAIDAMIDEQLAYTERFASDRHFQRELDRQVSPSNYLNRALMYLGTAWAASYMGNEYGDNRYGYVWEYQPIDDGKTCRNCHDAKGFYLSGQGPMPGQICFGGWRCRCRRVEVYNPVEWERLIGR